MIKILKELVLTDEKMPEDKKRKLLNGSKSLYELKKSTTKEKRRPSARKQKTKTEHDA